MITKRTIYGARAAFASALCIAALAAPVSAESIRSALAAAYENSNLLEQNRALLRSEDENVAVALSALRPQINGTSTITQSDQASNLPGGDLTSTISIGLDLLIFDAGSTRLGVEAAKETVLAVRAQLVALEQQVLFDAVQAYLNVLRDQRVVDLRQNNVRLITQELRAAQDRFEVGEVTRTDVSQAEARLAESRGELAAAQGDLEISRELYRVTVGRRPGVLEPGRFIYPLPNSESSAIAVGQRENPNIDQAQREIRANELNAARAEANIRPRITLQAQAGHSERIDNNSSIGLTMNVPIYQGGQLRALVRRANAVVHASRANLNQQVLLVQQGISDAWTNLVVSRAQVVSSQQQIRAAEVAFEGVREEATLGARTTLDVLDAEQDLQDARTNLVVAETTVFIAGYQLLASMGVLTVDDLDLAVERYDPSEYYNAVKNAPVPVSPQGRNLNRILKRYDN
ncbi:TolC family outer membrane protein [Litoreibacter roseus]|uniref:Transporter n=1 Tax=Litoreibacter roseus TaxID=2601869 RepID=A0A6N6JB06_9RHOB|nr:TolC family outer membrane protein [Litoreibacter roseus]GFE63423.1 transporter [Litoreibacter roseus]